MQIIGLKHGGVVLRHSGALGTWWGVRGGQEELVLSGGLGPGVRSW